MSTGSRFAIDPVELPPPAVSPEAIDRGDSRTLWITMGQAALAVWFVYGFGATEQGPTTVLGISFALLGGFVLLSPRGTFGTLRIQLPVVLFTIWYASSYRWTWNQGNWWVHAKAELPEMAIPIVVASLMPIERITQAFRVGLYGMILWTLVYTGMHPVDSTTYLDPIGHVSLPSWHGSFGHKNDMAFFLLMCLTAVLVYEPRRWLRWLSSGATIGLILLGRSGTGILAFAVLVLLTAWLRAHRNQPDYLRRWFAAASVFLGVGVVGVLVPLTPVLMKLGGKDPTISGRTQIWTASLHALWPHKWTGFGPGGVWDDQATEPTRSIIDQIGFIVFHAHNGPLELAMRLGLIGLAIVLLMALSAARNAWWLQRARDDAGRWIVALLALLAITWFSENTMTGRWIGLIAMAAAIGRRNRDEISARPAVDSTPARPRVL